MYELKTNTAVRIAVGPLVDPGDGKTAETSLTVTGLSCQIYQIKNDGGAVVRAQFAPTASGGNNDMALVTSSTDGMYDLELTAAQLNWLGNGRITFYDVDGFLVHWIDILVVSAAYFDWKYGTTAPKVDVDTIKTQSVTCAAGVTVRANVGTTNDSTAQTGDAFARLGAPAGASVSADVAAVKAETAAIVEDTGTTLDTLIKDIPTNAEFEARTLVAAGYGTAANQSTIIGYIDTEVAAILAAVDTEVAAIKAVTDKLDTAVELDGAVYRLTENALEQAPTGGTAPTVEQIRAEIDANSTQLAAIVADTNELQTDLTNGGRVDLLIDGIKAKTDKMTYTSGNDLDVNVQKINDVTLTGNGSTTPIGAA